MNIVTKKKKKKDLRPFPTIFFKKTIPPPLLPAAEFKK